MSDTQYFNFPVKLLEGIFDDKQKVLSDALYYFLYSRSLILNDGERFPRGEQSSDIKDFKSSAKYFNVSLGNDRQSFKRGKELFDSIPTDSPKVGLNTSIYWDFYKNHKSDYEIACLTAFLAIKSIIGREPYKKITNLYLWSRMSGKSKTVTDWKELPEHIYKYCNEYQTSKKIIPALCESWGLIYYSRYTRGFYVSFTLTLEKLVFEAEKRRKSTKDKQRKELEKEAVKKALEQLSKPLASPMKAPSKPLRPSIVIPSQ